MSGGRRSQGASMNPKSGDDKRLYDDLSWTFPIITPLEHYLKETESALRLIRKHSLAPVKTILHLGCGGGHNDYVFKKHARVTGVDISPSMLKLARALNPEVAHLQGDLRKIRLKKAFDVVAAWDSINHMLTTRDLAKAFATAHDHLIRGGVFFFLLDTDKEQFRQNATRHFTNRKGRVEVTFIENMYDPDPADTTYESTFIYLIRRNGKLTIETDRFLCGLYSVKEVLGLLKRAGFKARFIKYKPGREALESDGTAQQEYYPAFIAIKA
jgi:SAM-dependent methyltransferase